MPVSREKFIRRLVESRVFTPAELDAFVQSSPEAQAAPDVQKFARALVRAGKLTTYQAAAIYQGKTKGLAFGPYVVLDELGAGGMGKVYKARHRHMNRLVAVKVLPQRSLKDQSAVQRFHREVEAAARLIHTNIVTAFDAGETEGLHYLVMEYVDGCDLSQVMRQHGLLSLEQAVECMIQAAQGLQFAHERGVVHRDIKPSNLLLAKDGTVKILDMGLARFKESPLNDISGAEANQLTQSGQIMGTVEYMAPEQAEDTHAADHRADVYSLGCTLYRLLTGAPAYEGDTVVKRILAHRYHPIPTLRDKRPDAPEGLDAAFQKMIAKQPADRQQSMKEVIADLEFALSPAPSTERRVRKGFSSDQALSFFLERLETDKGRTDETLDHQPGQEETAVQLGAIAAAATGSSPSGIGSSRRIHARKPSSRLRAPLLVAGSALLLLTLVSAVALLRWLNPAGSGDGAVAEAGGEVVSLPSLSEVWPASQGVEPAVASPEAPPGWAFSALEDLASANSELAGMRYACVSRDELTAIYRRAGRAGSADLWQAVRADASGPFGSPTDLGPTINSVSNESGPCLSADGLELIFNRVGDEDYDLYRSARATTADPWGEPEAIQELNSPSIDRDATLSGDGRILIFTSDRPGGSGGEDLWVSRREATDKEFGPPQNMGDVVNSAAEESGPTLSGDGLLLIFSSNRVSGLGLHDLWACTRPSAEAPFDPPFNLGTSVNTTKYDTNPCLSYDGRTLYYSRGDGPLHKITVTIGPP
ncbi:MAG: serine/threonine-protein kinase [Planctomycetes bacterium]|nr:serine/threonine-protein kinase [Planctomycetota bacterium]